MPVSYVMQTINDPKVLLNHILLFFSVDIANYELTVLAIDTQQL